MVAVAVMAFTTASCGGESSTVTPSTEPTPTEPSVTPSALKISYEGSEDALDSVKVIEEGTVKLVTSYTPADMNLTFKWEVKDTNIATVEDGLVTGVTPGKTTMTVSCIEYPGLSKILFVNVTDKVGQKGVGTGTSAEDPLFIGNEGSQEPIEVYFIEVQKQYADAIYIRKGNVDILIDAGQYGDGQHVKEFLQSHMKDKRLDMVMVSHTHGDHYGGMSQALEAVDDVSLFVDYGGDSKNSYSDARDKFIAKGSKYYGALDCVNYEGGAVKDWYLTKDLSVSILDTGNYIGKVGSASNPQSVASLFKYKDFSFYTAGDLTSDSERDMLKREPDLGQVTLAKASHHGSHTSNSNELFERIDPYIVGISAAITGSTPENQQGIKGHPAADAIHRIYQSQRISKNLNVYFNGVNGDMCFSTHGGETDVTFQGSPTHKGYYAKNADGVLEKVTGEENCKLHESKLFDARGYGQYLPDWAKKEFGYTK